MDIVDQLRWHHEAKDGDAHATAGEAADEIERLRAALEAIVDEYGRDPETVHIPAGLIRRAEIALYGDDEQSEDTSQLPMSQKLR